jgi:hypothetical protein
LDVLKKFSSLNLNFYSSYQQNKVERVAKESMAGIIEMEDPTGLPTSITNVNEPLVVKLSKELDR